MFKRNTKISFKNFGGKMKIIAFGTMKGGVGKTTLAFNLAAILEERSRVLLVDLDPQCNLNQCVGLDLNTRDGYTIKDIFENPRIDPALAAVEVGDNETIIPGSIDLTVTEARLPSRAGKELVLRRYVEDHIDFFSRYDYLILDTGPSMSNINQNGFVAADKIILVSDVSLHSIRGAELFMFLWRDIREALRLPDNISALILNNYDGRINLAKELTAFCQENEELAPLLIPTAIPARVSMKKSAVESTPICQLYPGDAASIALRQVAAELAEKGVF